MRVSLDKRGPRLHDKATLPTWPTRSMSTNSLPRCSKCWYPCSAAPHRATSVDAGQYSAFSVKLSSVWRARRPSNQSVSMRLPTKSADCSNLTMYSTVVRMSPRICNSFNATIIALRAASRSGPLAKMWPNCESANSWMRPLLLTEKYPHTSMDDRNCSSLMVPDEGWKPASGFSAVMRTAMQCRRTGRRSE